jgi:hypothetical protein
MVNRLGVDADGLRVGAARSAGVADDLAGGGTGGGSGDQPSHAGVAAFDGAVMSVRSVQSGRVEGQSGEMVTGGRSFDDTESGSSAAIARSM